MHPVSTVIVLAHPDDEALSCGGLIQKRLEERTPVSLYIVYGRQYNYGEGDQYMMEQVQALSRSTAVLGMWTSDDLDTAEQLESCSVTWTYLDEGEPQKVGYTRVLKEVEQLIAREASVSEKLEIVLPSRDDRNQDHRWLHDLGRIAVRPWAYDGKVSKVLGALSPDGVPKDSCYYVPMTEVQLQKKLKAVECYRREMRQGAHPRSPEMLYAWHKVAGSQCFRQYAEPYQLYYQRE